MAEIDPVGSREGILWTDFRGLEKFKGDMRIEEIGRVVDNILEALESRRKVTNLGGRREEMWVRWEPPPVDRVKINMDGAFDNNLGVGRAGG
ncbi:OLC1v1008408C1 [Oldenlandia corymbosa var. corymbosa]|uniref:OLC1v1008408C1 n=1 Tax=Oldenlandia corymbosa var. corymbosa TaxID=529605 RepID=A0AAV1DLH6_OLDCO|nr:OLC1v1008408C1 [Oldenlandia corymbosa var. corymbosa]